MRIGSGFQIMKSPLEGIERLRQVPEAPEAKSLVLPGKRLGAEPPEVFANISLAERAAAHAFAKAALAIRVGNADVVHLQCRVIGFVAASDMELE